MKLIEFASLLNGRQMGEEMDSKLKQIAKENDFVVIYGSSDDGAVIDGVLGDEVDLYGGGEIPFYKGDLLKKECEDEDCPHEDRMRDSAIIVEALWDEAGKPPWSYNTAIPHCTFIIKEGEEDFCEGIVFKRENIK